MQRRQSLTMAFMLSLLLLSPTLAIASTREDNSNFLVWMFLGICGLIIFLQMVPVISLAFGLMKGITGSTEKEELEAATSKYN